jgi:hypothetical protein
MTRRIAVALGAAFVVVSLASLGIARAALDVAGFYSLDAAGDYFSRSTVHLRQEGNTVIGDYDPHGSLHGTMKDNILSATWSDPRGSGWLTFKFNLQGSGFSGDWGYGGKKPSGQLIGKRILAPQ